MTEQEPGGRPWWGEPWGESQQAAAGDDVPAPPRVAPPTAVPGGVGVPPPPYGGGVGNGAGGPGPVRNRGAGYVLLVAIVALIAGGGGAAAGVSLTQSDNNTVKTYHVTPAAEGADSTTSSSAIETVAAAVQPSVVLVNEQTNQLQGTGSGVVLDAANGYILTNNHVISAVATGGGSLTVTTNDGRTGKATIVGRDPSADIAVIKVSMKSLTQARMGNSKELKVGQTVVAFGAPLGLQGSVTSGIVSALDRPVSTEDTNGGTSQGTEATIDAIQTDAAINPGNSGGPLVDLNGAVIGINSAIATVPQQSLFGQSDQESGSIGVGFAIPINEALYTADQLIKTGHAVHAIIGVSLSVGPDSDDTNGAQVAQVVPGGPAAKAGIKPGDVIVKVDGKPISDADTAIVAIRANHKPGDVVQVTVLRDGQTKRFTVTLGASAPS
ncbi:MAG TPA: trypsin-like peptidase domain-containing protein [Mycobacteriales bacterium]